MCIDMTNFSLNMVTAKKLKSKNPQLVSYFFILYVILILFVSSIPIMVGADQSASNLPRSRIGKANVTIMTTDVYNTPGISKPAGFDQEFQHETSTIEFSDDEPIEGQTVMINTTVFNIGTESTYATVYFYDGPQDNNDLIGTDVVNVPVLGYDEATTNWDTTNEDELHKIYVIVIPDDPDNETDPTNNEGNKDIIVNQIPMAIISHQSQGIEDELIEFDGSGSIDTPSDINAGLSFYWDFGDPFSNETNPNELSGVNLSTPSHTYTQNGEYTITLRVEDDGNAYHINSTTIQIDNIAPIAKIQVTDITPYEDSVITFNAIETYDTSSDLGTLEYAWDFGDGSDEVKNEIMVQHSYPKEGIYYVTLQVKDDDNFINTTKVKIDVINFVPVADAGQDQTVYEDSVVTFIGNQTIDTPSDFPSLNYTWDFGDGTPIKYGVQVNHIYNISDSYTVILTVQDNDGAQNKDYLNVVVKNVAPYASVSQDHVKVYEDELILFNASGSSDTISDLPSLNYTWDFGNDIIKYGKSTTHYYTQKGEYAAELKVTDDDGEFSITQINISIVNVPPIADFGLEDNTITVGKYEHLIFDGSNSTDTISDLPFLEYEWDFGDNTTATGILVSHNYTAPGIYNVTLKVIDDDGDWNITRLLVIIQDLLYPDVTLTIEIEPTKSTPNELVVISGKIDYDYNLPMEDYKLDLTELTLARISVQLVETDETWHLISDRHGQYNITFKAPHQEGTYTLKTSVYYKLDVIAEDTKTFEVKSSSEPSGGIILTQQTIIISLAIGIAGCAGAVIVGTDIGRFKFFCWLIPLYTKLNREAVLDNFTRGRIYEHIRMNPGEHFSGLKKTLELRSGSLTYHLRVLEKEDYIKSTRDGMYKRFYPIGMKIDAGKKSRSIQELILEELIKNPRSSQKEIAKALGVDKSTVNYHINMMVGAGIIRSDKLGRTKRYYIDESAVDEFVAVD